MKNHSSQLCVFFLKKSYLIQTLHIIYFILLFRAIAEWMTAPDTQFLLDMVRPDFLLLRVSYFYYYVLYLGSSLFSILNLLLLSDYKQRSDFVVFNSPIHEMG